MLVMSSGNNKSAMEKKILNNHISSDKNLENNENSTFEKNQEQQPPQQQDLDIQMLKYHLLRIRPWLYKKKEITIPSSPPPPLNTEDPNDFGEQESKLKNYYGSSMVVDTTKKVSSPLVPLNTLIQQSYLPGNTMIVIEKILHREDLKGVLSSLSLETRKNLISTQSYPKDYFEDFKKKVYKIKKQNQITTNEISLTEKPKKKKRTIRDESEDGASPKKKKKQIVINIDVLYQNEEYDLSSERNAEVPSTNMYDETLFFSDDEINADEYQ